MKSAIGLRKPIQTFTMDLAVTNITFAAWVQVIAALTFGASAVEVFNPSSSPIIISQGGPGNETAANKLVPYTIPPGGTSGPYVFEFKAGLPVTVKALDADINAGRFILNFFA